MNTIGFYFSVIFSFAIARCCIMELGRRETREFFKKTSVIEVVLVNIIQILIAYIISIIDYSTLTEDGLILTLIFIQFILIVCYIGVANLIYEIWKRIV